MSPRWSLRLMGASRRETRSERRDRLVVRVDGVAHEIVKLDGYAASVTLSCVPNFAVLVDPNTIVYEHGEIDVDCMTCLVRRAWV